MPGRACIQRGQYRCCWDLEAVLTALGYALSKCTAAFTANNARGAADSCSRLVWLRQQKAVHNNPTGEGLWTERACDEDLCDGMWRGGSLFAHDAADLLDNAVPEAIAVPEVQKPSVDPSTPARDPAVGPLWIFGLPELHERAGVNDHCFPIAKQPCANVIPAVSVCKSDAETLDGSQAA